MASLEELSRLATRLNTQSDQVQEALTMVNSALASLSLGVEAWTTIQRIERRETSDNEQSERFAECLEVGYARVGRTWSLLYREVRVYEPRDSYEVANTEVVHVNELLSAPRHIRLKAAASLPELLSELAVEAERIIASSTKGLEAAREVLFQHTGPETVEPRKSVLPPLKPHLQIPLEKKPARPKS